MVPLSYKSWFKCFNIQKFSGFSYAMHFLYYLFAQVFISEIYIKATTIVKKYCLFTKKLMWSPATT